MPGNYPLTAQSGPNTGKTEWRSARVATGKGWQMSLAGSPVVFVHGLWLHASSWGPWVDLFREAGYQPRAPGWPGTADTVEETRQQAGQAAGKGIDDVVTHYAGIIGGLDT